MDQKFIPLKNFHTFSEKEMIEQSEDFLNLMTINFLTPSILAERQGL